MSDHSIPPPPPRGAPIVPPPVAAELVPEVPRTLSGASTHVRITRLPQCRHPWPRGLVWSLWIIAGLTCVMCVMSPFEASRERARQAERDALAKTGALDTEFDQSDFHRARRLAKVAVLARVRWPHDAEFLGVADVGGHDKTPTDLIVLGRVKAKNGFGASLTHDYAVRLRKQNGELTIVEAYVAD